MKLARNPTATPTNIAIFNPVTNSCQNNIVESLPVARPSKMMRSGGNGLLTINTTNVIENNVKPIKTESVLGTLRDFSLNLTRVVEAFGDL
jgi:hypothetical protein